MSGRLSLFINRILFGVTMLAEFLDRLSELITGGITPAELAPEGRESRRRLIWNPVNKTTHEFLTKPLKRGAKVHTLASLIQAVQKLGKPEATIIWVRAGEVVAALNDKTDDRDGARITFTFPLHPAFAAIREAEINSKRDHATFLRWLRTDIGDAVIGPDDLLSKLRVVKFDTLTSSSSESAKDLAKMGREVSSMVCGIESLPDKFLLTFHPFPTLVRETEDAGLDPVDVNLTCQPKVEEAVFLVKPVAGEIVMATAEAQENLRAIIQERLPGFDVFSGTPE